MTVESKESATRSVESSEQIQQQVYKQPHQPPSETQQILTEPHGDNQGVVGGEGASTESDWVISVESFKEKLNSAGQDTMPSIYKVSKNLRGGDDKAYVPQIVSLGPYHHGKKALRPMEQHKMLVLKFFLERKKQDVKIYLDSIKELESQALGCYEGPINMKRDEFVQMLVLDGFFVLEIFRFALGRLKKQHGSGRSQEVEQLDPAFAMNLKLIQRDMIMLENQIPLFILDRLLGLQLGFPDQQGFVAELAVNFFSQLMPAEESLAKGDQNIRESSPEGSTAFDTLSDGGLHFLDVFRRSLLHTWPGSLTGSSDHANGAADKRSLNPIHCLLHTCPGSLTGSSDHANRAADKRDNRPLLPIRCVTELRDAGVKFKKRDSQRFWDIRFKNGVLEIPRLLIDDGTKSLFLNFIAFEQRRLVAFDQTRLDCTNSFSSYVLFMDYLIDSSEDVRHLQHCGIIEHWLGNDNKVAELFDRLWREVVFDIDNRHFSGLSDEVNQYCRQRRHGWRADLQHKHCSNPWVIISVIAAVVLLLLTLTQTFYAVYGYHRPS